MVWIVKLNGLYVASVDGFEDALTTKLAAAQRYIFLGSARRAAVRNSVEDKAEYRVVRLVPKKVKT